AVDGGTGQVRAAERFFLRLRARPLHEFFAVVVVGVPGRRLHPDLAFGTVSIEVFVDEDRTNRRVAVAYGVHERAMECAPMIVREAETVESGRDEGGLDALRACIDFGRERREVATRGQRDRELAVADDHDDLLSPEPGDVRA